MAAGVSVLLAARNLEIRRGARRVIEEVSFSVSAGELVAIMGASGSGKSTILRAVAGLDPIESGAIDVGGLELNPGGLPRGRRLRELHRRVGMVFQFHHLFAHMSALDNVCLAPVHVLRHTRADAECRARALLTTLGAGQRADAMPHELSGGEAQRVAIARALAVDPPILLMDEPTASLDAARRAELAALLAQLARQGRTVVVATHDAEFARASAHRVIVLEGGRIAREGVPAAALE